MTLPDPATEPTIDARRAFTLLGISEHTGYRAVKDGTFPVPVLRLSKVIRIPTLPLLRLLGLGEREN